MVLLFIALSFIALNIMISTTLNRNSIIINGTVLIARIIIVNIIINNNSTITKILLLNIRIRIKSTTIIPNGTIISSTIIHKYNCKYYSQ